MSVSVWVWPLILLLQLLSCLHLKTESISTVALALAQNHSQLSKAGDTMLGSKHWRRCASHGYTCTNWHPWNHSYRSLDGGEVMIGWWEDCGETKGECEASVWRGRGWVRGRPPSPTEWRCGDHWLHCGVQQLVYSYNGGRPHQPIIITLTRSSSGHCCCCISHDFEALLPSLKGCPSLMLFWTMCLSQWPVASVHCQYCHPLPCRAECQCTAATRHSASISSYLGRPRPPALRDEDHSLQLLQTIQQRKPME